MAKKWYNSVAFYDAENSHCFIGAAKKMHSHRSTTLSSSILKKSALSMRY